VSIRLAKTHELESIEMRAQYCKVMIALAEQDERIVALDADLIKSSGMYPFLKKFPERTFDIGIQEANMMGVAAGLSATGKIPFTHTFAPFASRRCFDQVFISCGYAKHNVKMVGSDPGITAAYNGGTHMPFEDVGLMRCVPEITIVEPTDSTMLEDLIKKIKDRDGLFYIRLQRKKAVKIFEEGSTFEIGKAVELREGTDLTILASGIMVAEALKAAEILQKEGISARVANLFTIKPIDREYIEKCARETGAIVTSENHNIINGLGSAVAEVLGETMPVPLERHGVKDMFGEVGEVSYLAKRFQLEAGDIVESCKKVLERKKS
jgi:transketolase